MLKNSGSFIFVFVYLSSHGHFLVLKGVFVLVREKRVHLSNRAKMVSALNYFFSI